MRGLFIGKSLHWAMIVVVIAVLYWLGTLRFHLLDYNYFLFIVLGLAAGCVVLVLVTYRQGDRITRDPLDVEEQEIADGD